MTARPQPLSHRWLKARAMRDWAAMQDVAAVILDRDPQARPIHRALARRLEETGETAQALPHWRALTEIDPCDIEAAAHLGTAALAQGVSPGAAAALASPAAPDSFRRVLTEVLSEPPLEAASQDHFRHIAICGVSFCGSTLLDRLLGALPGVVNIGESHWLTEHRANGGGAPIDFTAPQGHDLRYCNSCGPACAVLDWRLRRALAACGSDWYAKIAHRLGSEILISADKNPPKLVAHDPLLGFDALVLFKSPEQAWASTLKRLPRGQDAAFYRQQCQAYLAVWADRYELLLEHFRPQGRMVFLAYEDLVSRPRPTLAALCGALDLPFDAGVLETLPLRHWIGGNPNANARLKTGPLAVESLVEPDLPDEHRRLIAQAQDAQAICARLRQSAVAG
ncbi:MAG: sulfotransferase [Alphaproteobacteria bacterium]|nr:sulfotransferase [Alphaproteobacteria bacterium]